MNFSCAEIYAGFDLRDRSYEKHSECNNNNKVNRQCFQQITGIKHCLRLLAVDRETHKMEDNRLSDRSDSNGENRSYTTADS